MMVIPAWLAPPLDPDILPIRLDPGPAFGTGAHPTTRLCLRAVERHLVPGASVIDLGTGTGILAIAAAKLGAAAVLAVDTHAESVRVARENAAANSVAQTVRVEEGSLEGILSGEWGRTQAPLVLANILAGVIVSLLEQGLGLTVAPGGLLVLSGMLSTQTLDIRARLQWAALEQVAQEEDDEWVCILARRP